MVKRIASTVVLTAALLAPAAVAHADDTPAPSGHTSTACLYERYWQADLCPGVHWVISKAEEDAQAQQHHVKRTYKPKAKYVTVRKGDTLWRIAVREYHNGHQWKHVARLNGIKGTSIKVGQHLRVR